MHEYNLLDSQQKVFARVDPNQMLPVTEVRQLVIPASQVSISAEASINIAMLNKLSGTIIDICEFQHHALISVEIDNQIIHSFIAQKSRLNMKLTLNQHVAVLFKAL